MRGGELLLIADGFVSGRGGGGGKEVRARTLDAVRGGVRLLQLRDHAASEEAFAEAALPFIAALREAAPDVRVFVNTWGGVACALGGGVHVGTRGPSVAEARERFIGTPLTAAVHSLAEAHRAAADGASALLFSPVYATGTKPGQPPAGLDALAAVAGAVAPVPVFALGGVTPGRVGACLGAGAYGVAVLSGVLDAPDPAAAAAAYLSALHP